MAIRRCEIRACGRKHYSKGYCQRHYTKHLRYGDPLAGREYQDTPEGAFLAYVEPLAWDDHLVWMGGLHSEGYGSIWVAGDHQSAHRYAWTRERGPVPDEMFVDHACHVRSCVNVEHLRLATRPQNGRNRAGANRNNALGVRNVYPTAHGSYVASVRKGGRRYRKTFPTVEAAADHAAALRQELFGDYQGRG